MTGVKRISGILLCYGLITGCGVSPPVNQGNICTVFDQNPAWYGYAKAAEIKWGTPVPILMAFIQRESSFRYDAMPPPKWLWFLPMGRKSSAKGYAQIKDAAWKDYTAEVGGLFISRNNIQHALDFIGWYNHRSNKWLGISRTDPRRLYLAYHEGHGGYRRRTYRKKAKVMRAARKVSRLAGNYARQLGQCEHRFQCYKWYQFWPFCAR